MQHRRRHQEDRTSGAEGTRKPLLRLVAVALSGLLMTGFAYNAFAGNGGGQGIYPPPPPPPRQDGDDDGLSSAEQAAIGVGAAAVVAAAGGAFGLFGGTDDDDEDTEMEDEALGAPSGDGAKEISAIRLVPGKKGLKAGSNLVFDLQVRAKGKKKWLSVSNRPEAAINVAGENSALVRMDGTKNTFCLPLTTPRSRDGQMVTVVGTFAPAGGSPMSAEAKVRVVVPGSDLAASAR